MEPYKVFCDHCNKKLKVSIESLIGKRIRCPSCQSPFKIPGPPTEENLLEEKLVEAGSGVGSGVGSGIGAFAGIKTGDSATGHSDTNFNFAGMDNGSAGLDDSGGFDYESYDDSDTEEIEYDESSFIDEEGEYYSEEGYSSDGYEESSSGQDYSGSYGYEKKPTDIKTVLLISAPAVVVFLVIAFIILSEKGYFSEGGRDNRQDGTRFAELGREVDGADLWAGGSAPTQLENSVSNALRGYQSAYSDSRFSSLQKRFRKAKDRHGSGRLSNSAYQSELMSIQSAAKSILYEIDPINYPSGSSR